MAVVQISKIQVRRGRKNSDSGLPQLASGEFGWAVDTQELYIGNGSVSEGAPAVGNTQILTNESNLFTLADQYSYKSNIGFISTNTTDNTSRTLQSKLDDFASAADFGMTGDSAQDVTALLQNAVDQLYINPGSVGTETSRVTLHFPAGVYTVSGTIYIPPYATLTGEGTDKTIIKNTGAQSTVFQTVNSDSTPGNPADHSTSTVLNQTTNLSISNMTLETTENNIILQMDSCKDSMFEKVNFRGAWNSTDGILSANTGVQMNNLSASVQSKNNVFRDCHWYSLSYAVYSDWDVNYNTWTHNVFSDLGLGFAFGVGLTTLDSSTASGIRTGAQYNKIQNSEFRDVYQQAIYCRFGNHNASENNTFSFVGNNGGADYEAQTPILQFDTNNNTSFYDSFSRAEVLGNDPNYISRPYLAEIQGSVVHDSKQSHYLNSITSSGSVYVTRFRLPNDIVNSRQKIEVHYHLSSLNYAMTRSGILRIISETNDCRNSDDYEYIGDADKETSIAFDTQLLDLNADSVPETIDVKVRSTMPSDDVTELRYTIKIIK